MLYALEEWCGIIIAMLKNYYSIKFSKNSRQNIKKVSELNVISFKGLSGLAQL